MVTIETSDEFTTDCQECGEALDTGVDNNRMIIFVKPCQNCIEKAKDDGYELGYAQGQADAED